MPTLLSSGPAPEGGLSSSAATAAFIPRSMLVPWSASPIAESSSVRWSRSCATSSAKRRTHASKAAVVTWSLIASDPPPQSRSPDRSVPERQELVVGLEQRDRRAGHLQRRDVGADQRPGHAHAVLRQDLVDLVVHHVELDQRRATQTVDERDDTVPRRERQVGQDRLEQHLGDLLRRRQRQPLPAGLAVDADAEPHLVLAE